MACPAPAKIHLQGPVARQLGSSVLCGHLDPDFDRGFRQAEHFLYLTTAGHDCLCDLHKIWSALRANELMRALFAPLLPFPPVPTLEAHLLLLSFQYLLCCNLAQATLGTNLGTVRHL